MLCVWDDTYGFFKEPFGPPLESILIVLLPLPGDTKTDLSISKFHVILNIVGLLDYYSCYLSHEVTFGSDILPCTQSVNHQF